MTTVDAGRLGRPLAGAAELANVWFVDGRTQSAPRSYTVPSPALPGVDLAAADVDVEAALGAARSAALAQPEWAEVPAMARMAIVRHLATYLESRREELAEMIVLESAKPLAHARAEVELCLRVLDTLCASVAEVSGSSRLDFMTGRRVSTILRPVGPALLVTPWNFPLNLGIRKLATALLAGCTAIWKPAERTPLTALLVAEGLPNLGLAPGVVSVLPTGRSPEVTAALMKSGLLRKLSFTGSTAVGKVLMAQASEQVMRASFELGGNGPAVIGAHADLDSAIAAVVQAKFVNNGQVCTTVNRLYVPSSRTDEIAEKIRRAMDQLVVGPPENERTVVGPVISTESARTLENLLTDAESGGATVTRHGTAPPATGNFVRPALVTGVRTEDPLAQRELFGPVIPMIGYDTIESAVAQANSTPYGLSAYVFSTDTTELDYCTTRLQAGMIAINRPSPSSVSTPFGGIGWSGYGRENGVRGIGEFLDETTLVY